MQCTRGFLSSLVLLVSLCTSVQLAPPAWAAPERSLEVYAIDVEGGQSTLIVSPSGESMLIDTGWPGFDGRDAARIGAAAKAAGVSKLDYLLITHFHRDHVGGVPQLAGRMKIGTFVDHGKNLEDSNVTREDYAAYEKAVAGAKRISPNPGDRIPIMGLEVEVLTAAGEHISKPLAGAGEPNPLCASEKAGETDPSENARSLGVLITYGKLRMLDIGDLSKQKEMELVCPNNLIGRVDLFIVTHHGSDSSNPAALVHAIRPRVAIMDNGAKKGGSSVAWTTVTSSPGLQDFWQLHYAVDGGKDHNVAPDLIANPEGAAGAGEDKGNYIHVTAKADGTMTQVNQRNGFKKDYGLQPPKLSGSAH
jgi:beta-lactamase superfamily II metal-dependent hydrolase